MPTLVEIKARCTEPNRVRQYLHDQGADFRGTDHQIDTYFRVPYGRLKLREGNIENHLIHYFRPNQTGPKTSKVLLYKSDPSTNLKKILSTANGILVVVDKQRDIYFIDNVKFHVDTVQALGSFVEIEAIDDQDIRSEAELLQQCNFYLQALEISADDLVANSYSDLLLEKGNVSNS